MVLGEAALARNQNQPVRFGGSVVHIDCLAMLPRSLSLFTLHPSLFHHDDFARRGNQPHALAAVRATLAKHQIACTGPTISHCIVRAMSLCHLLTQRQ